MLHELLAAYLKRVERSVRECSAAYVEHYVEEILTPERINLRIRIRFEGGHRLEISEALVVDGERVVPFDYRYPCQDDSNRLGFRYDCAPHFSALAGFPHHKHMPSAVLPATRPDIE